MFVEKLDLIFVHIPKTGGNTISTHLLGTSDEKKELRNHRDGVDRFEIRGQYTRRKHQTLQQYRDALGERFSSVRVMTSLRHPVDRLVSTYFSPSRRMRRTAMAKAKSAFYRYCLRKDYEYSARDYRYDKVEFDMGAFAEIVSRAPTQSSFLMVDGRLRKPDIVIDFSQFEESSRSALRDLGIVIDAPVHANRSMQDATYKSKIVNDPRVIDLVRESRHAEDWQNFPELAW
jgi:hypothetical protein